MIFLNYSLNLIISPFFMSTLFFFIALSCFCFSSVCISLILENCLYFIYLWFAYARAICISIFMRWYIRFCRYYSSIYYLRCSAVLFSNFPFVLFFDSRNSFTVSARLLLLIICASLFHFDMLVVELRNFSCFCPILSLQFVEKSSALLILPVGCFLILPKD